MQQVEVRVRQSKYVPPEHWEQKGLLDLIAGIREMPENQTKRFDFEKQKGGTLLRYVGDLSLLQEPCVAVVGTRNVSEDGKRRARRLARELVGAGIVIMSGLALGVDTEAFEEAIRCGGKVVGVIGTPLDSVNPTKNAKLQEVVYKNHLLISPFEHGTRVFPSNFPKRNKVMAALSDATVIVEASETSGTIHQAAECQRLGRFLFIMSSLAHSGIEWPKSFLAKYEKAFELTAAQQIIEAVGSG